MRHNQNGRRFRGRGNGQSQNAQGQNHHGGGGGFRRINPRVQIFDSNGPDVRIRGNAYQVNEKYLALAKDAASAGDRILAESYLQHAEHYQRLINEIAEEYGRNQPQFQQPQDAASGNGEDMSMDPVSAVAQPGAEQPVLDAELADLDQGFLRGPSRAAAPQPTQDSGADDLQRPHPRQHSRHRESEQV
jgi:hypothetical protein